MVEVDIVDNPVFGKLPTHNDYLVSKCGKIKSLKSKSEKILIPFYHKKTGYYYVTLCENNKRQKYSVHCLVAMAFLGHIPCGCEVEVDHKNEIKTDNRLENLQIITHRGNISRSKKKHSTSSIYCGVSWDKNSSKWYAKIRFGKRNVGIGFFDVEKEASDAYEKALSEIQKGTYCPPPLRETSSSCKGVYFDKRTEKWKVVLTIEKKRTCFGYFKTEEEAIEKVKSIKNA